MKSYRDTFNRFVDLMRKAAVCGPVLISCGGGVSPEIPIEDLQAMAEVILADNVPADNVRTYGNGLFGLQRTLKYFFLASSNGWENGS